MTDNIILTDLSFRYREQFIFKNFNAKICRGATTLVFGPSGSGKTTLLRLLLFLNAPSGGNITGISNGETAAVFQEDRLALHLSATMNIALVLPKSFPKDEILRQLRAVGIDETDSPKAVSEFSGGMRRRVALVRAVISNRPVILMDEPFKELDETTKQLVADYIKKETNKKTLIIVSHDETDAALFSADILRINQA